MSNQALQDREARAAVVCCLEQNILLEAGAGSGKTSCLVNRMAALIMEGRCSVKNIAAVTFTRKAAAELKERFQLKLEDLLGKEADQAVRQRLFLALDDLDQAFLGTIHSFCARLLRERPVEAGLSPDFREVEGLEEDQLQDLAWEEYLLSVRLTNGEILKKLQDAGVAPQDLKGAFTRISAYPDVEMFCRAVPSPDLTEVRGQLMDFCRRASAWLPGQRPEKGWDGLQQILLRIIRWQKVFDLQEDRCLMGLLEKIDKQGSIIQNRWGCKEEAKEAAHLFAKFRREYLEPSLRQWREYRHDHVMQLLLPAARHYRDVRLRENVLNFQDLLQRAAEMLRQREEVRRYFQTRFTHLLVDEFQDTDPIQAEVMFYLTGADVLEKEWHKLHPKPGSLFVVGDPKQSIYRFRRADIATYNKVKELILHSGGQVLYLTTNFRSLPGIVQWTNKAFTQLFAPPKPPYQADFLPMDTHRGQGSDEGCIRKLVLTGADNNQEAIAREDAERIASWIRFCLDGGLSINRTPEERAAGVGPGVEPRDFLILVHYKAFMSFYARALEKYGIPVSLTGESSMAASLELRELLPLLQALADPDNPLPLVAALRGIFFGVSDAMLYRFREAGGNFSFLKPVPEGGGMPDAPPYLEPRREKPFSPAGAGNDEVAQVFTPIWEDLARYWKWSRELAPSSALEKIIEELGLLPLALAGDLGRGRAACILQALELLRAQEEGGQASFPAAVEFLAAVLDKGLEDELDVAGGLTPAVRLMNLHKAKGLEAPVVILANPGRSPSPDPALHVVRKGSRAEGYMVVQKPGVYSPQTLAQPVGWDKHLQEEKHYQQAERVRLLYVAATRARDVLVISTFPPAPGKSPWQALEAFLDEAPVLEDVTGGPPPEEERAATNFTQESLKKIGEQISERLAVMQTPGYSRTSAAERAAIQGKAPDRRATGRGISFGNVIHRSLEYIALGEGEGDLEDLVQRLLQEEGRPAENQEAVVDHLRKVLCTHFWQRVRNAVERQTEVPFGIWKGSNYLRGVIDLAFKEEGGWVLVDYKSDSVAGGGHLRQLAAYYGPQVQAYARSFESISGETVSSSGLFFTDVLEFVEIL